MKIEKPWGYEKIWAKTKKYVGKILVIRQGESLSLQYHKKKDETIIVELGKIELQIEDQTFILDQGDSYHIPPKTKHRIKALAFSRVFEVSTPQLNDVVRLEDDYGRVEK